MRNVLASRNRSTTGSRATARSCPEWLLRELRSDHAGETGAVAIYRGILAVSSDETVRHFARRHLETERAHLATVGSLLPPSQRSLLTGLWTVAGFITGALPAVFGRNAVYATVDVVETFVDQHYRQQIQSLSEEGGWDDLGETLEGLRRDEVAHRDEARRLRASRHGMLLRLWLWAVARGSASAVRVARRF